MYGRLNVWTNGNGAPRRHSIPPPSTASVRTCPRRFAEDLEWGGDRGSGSWDADRVRDPIDRGATTGGAQGRTRPGPTRSVASRGHGRDRAPNPARSRNLARTHPRLRRNGSRRRERSVAPCRPASATRRSVHHQGTAAPPRPSRARARRSRPSRRRGTPPGASSTSEGSAGMWLAFPPVDPSEARTNHRECNPGRAPSSVRPRMEPSWRTPCSRGSPNDRASRPRSAPLAGCSSDPMTDASPPPHPRTGSASGSLLRSESELPTAAVVGDVDRVSQARSFESRFGLAMYRCCCRPVSLIARPVPDVATTPVACKGSELRVRDGGKARPPPVAIARTFYKMVTPGTGAYSSIYVRSCESRLRSVSSCGDASLGARSRATRAKSEAPRSGTGTVMRH